MDWEEAPKRFQKLNLHQKKVMVSGGLLPVWATTAFGIPEKPLYLRRMLSKSMRCTKLQCLQPALVNKKGPILHSNAWPCNHVTKTSWTNWATKFCLIHYTHLTSPPTTISSSISTTLCRENTQPAGGRKCFQKAYWILKHGFLWYKNKQSYFSLAKMCWLQWFLFW